MSINDFPEMTILLCLIYFFLFMQKFNQPVKDGRKIFFFFFFFFSFYAEIQDGCQKWRENDFWRKVPFDSAHSCGPKISSKLLYLPPFLI